MGKGTPSKGKKNNPVEDAVGGHITSGTRDAQLAVLVLHEECAISTGHIRRFTVLEYVDRYSWSYRTISFSSDSLALD